MKIKFFRVILRIMLIIFMPAATIMALNILFSLNIPLTFITWLAALMLICVFYNGPK